MADGRLDPIIHGQSRLRIMAALRGLGVGDQVAFVRAQEMLNMTSGNLSVHLRTLEEAGYVEQTKVIQVRTVTTYVSLTDAGRAAFDRYVRELEGLLGKGARSN